MTTKEIRADIYEHIEKVIGRHLTNEEHKALKKQLTDHARNFHGNKTYHICKRCREKTAR